MPLRNDLKARKPGEPLLPIVLRELRRERNLLIGAVLTTAILAPFGYGWAWFALWLLPSATWLLG
jgi:hypothetical protein